MHKTMHIYKGCFVTALHYCALTLYGWNITYGCYSWLSNTLFISVLVFPYWLKVRYLHYLSFSLKYNILYSPGYQYDVRKSDLTLEQSIILSVLVPAKAKEE